MKEAHHSVEMMQGVDKIHGVHMIQGFETHGVNMIQRVKMIQGVDRTHVVSMIQGFDRTHVVSMIQGFDRTHVVNIILQPICFLNGNNLPAICQLLLCIHSGFFRVFKFAL